MADTKETVVDVAPYNWDVKSLGDITDNYDKKRKPISGLERAKIKGDYPYCGANGIVDYINSYIFDGEYVLLAEDGGYWGKCQKSSYIMSGKFWVNNHAHILAAKDKLANNYFLMYMLNYLNLDPYIGGDARGKLTQAIMKSLQIPLPPLAEQRNIAHILSNIQAAIETQERIIRTTTELKKALMQKLFTEGLHGEAQKKTEIGLVPKNWEVKQIDEVYDYTNKPRGLDLSKLKQAPFVPMDLIPDDNLFVKDFEARRISELSSGTYIEKGDLLIAKITPSFENGKQAIVNFGHPFGFATTEVIPVKGKENISCREYLFYYLLKHDVRAVLAGKMEGSTGRQRLSKAILGETLIPLPPYKEQVEIANTFIKVDNKIQFAKAKKAQLSVLFKSMLHHLMTGQIRVKDMRF